jgi:hypothetical protein
MHSLGFPWHVNFVVKENLKRLSHGHEAPHTLRSYLDGVNRCRNTSCLSIYYRPIFSAHNYLRPQKQYWSPYISNMNHYDYIGSMDAMLSGSV